MLLISMKKYYASFFFSTLLRFLANGSIEEEDETEALIGMYKQFAFAKSHQFIIILCSN